MNRIELENRIAQLARENWKDNAVEALVGTLSTLTTDQQLEVLVKSWEQSE